MSLNTSPKDCNGNKKGLENTGETNSNDAIAQTKPFVFPPCWEDPLRMEVLFAPFRDRSVNTQNYDSKMNFWEELIKDYCLYKGASNFNIQELRVAFARGAALTTCLDTVIEKMSNEVKIRTLEDYEYDPLYGWTWGWAMKAFVKKPLGLAENGKNQTLEYVHLEVMMKFCKDIQTGLLVANQGKVLEFDILKATLDKTPLQLTKKCFYLSLHTLHAQRKLGLDYKVVDKKRRVHLVKIPSKADSSIDINETDLYVHKLEVTLANLMKHLDTLDEDIKENDSKAKEYLKLNKRHLAKTFLRKKHLKEKSFEKFSNTLHNIESLHLQVQEAKCNGKIVDAYKVGKKALQNILNESGLTYDNVDEVLVQVREVMDEHNEVQDSLANVNLNESKDYDNDELEQELRQIMGENDIKSPPTPKEVKAKTKFTAVAHINLGTPVVDEQQRAAAATTPTGPKQVVITDEDLLAMLEGLEVEENTLSTSSNSVVNSQLA